MSNPYFEACRQAAASIDIDALSALTPGKALGEGSVFSFAPLGKLSLGGTEPTHVGLKSSPFKGSQPLIRVEQELAFIATVVDHSPEFQTFVPSFMSLVAVEGVDAAEVILTEDASEGGQYQVASTPASEAVRRMLMKPFDKPEGTKIELNKVRCNNILAFIVNGRQRLLDFTPFPVNNAKTHSSHQVNVEPAMDLVAETTIRVPADSPLGQHLTK